MCGIFGTLLLLLLLLLLLPVALIANNNIPAAAMIMTIIIIIIISPALSLANVMLTDGPTYYYGLSRELLDSGDANSRPNIIVGLNHDGVSMAP